MFIVNFLKKKSGHIKSERVIKKDRFVKNTEVSNLPQENPGVYLITAANRIIKQEQKAKKGGVIDVSAMQEVVVQEAVNVKNEKINNVRNVVSQQKTVHDELADVVKILQDAITLAQLENSSLGDLDTPEFEELRQINVITTAMVKSVLSGSLSYQKIFDLRRRLEEKINTIVLLCHTKNIKMNGLNAIALCGNKILVLKSRSEFQVLEDETMKHRLEFQKVYPTKQNKSFGR
jgi:hypothetical protein